MQQIVDNLPIGWGDSTLQKPQQARRQNGNFVRRFHIFAITQSIMGFDWVVANQQKLLMEPVPENISATSSMQTPKPSTRNACAQNYTYRASKRLPIGDGANDLKMIAAAGLGFAFHAVKPLVREQAPHTVNKVGLDAILHPFKRQRKYQPHATGTYYLPLAAVSELPGFA